MSQCTLMVPGVALAESLYTESGGRGSAARTRAGDRSNHAPANERMVLRARDFRLPRGVTQYRAADGRAGARPGPRAEQDSVARGGARAGAKARRASSSFFI